MQVSVYTRVKDRGRQPEGGEWEPNQVLLQKPVYVPCSNYKAKTLQECNEHTNQQCRNYPLEDTNTMEKECDQVDTWIVRYGQNIE
jgi:hypothetical protein